jgi:ATHILA ORF-1 family
MCNRNFEVGFTKLRFFLGFHRLPTGRSRGFNGGYDKKDFWELVTGYCDYKEYRARSIKHPVIRCIQRALAHTIFARGDDIDEVTIEEMELLDHMLAPESRLERPDLMFLMEKYWMRVRDETKEDGIITCTTFPPPLHTC